MQLKQFYDIATKDSSWKSATTFGDLPDWWVWKYFYIATTPLVNYTMTSSNGNILRVTGHLCGEFTDPRWIPRKKASDEELWCFLWSASE